MIVLINLVCFTFAASPTGGPCAGPNDCYVSTDCCGTARFVSATYNGQEYTPMFPGQMRVICYTATSKSWKLKDKFGVETTY